MTKWIARVDSGISVTSRAAEGIRQAFAVDGAQVREFADQLSVWLPITADLPEEATRLALAAVRDAAGPDYAVQEVGVEVLTAATSEHRRLHPVLPALISSGEIAALGGLTQSRVNQLAKTPGFPPAVLVTKLGPLRLREQVVDYLAARNATPGRPSRKDVPLE